MPAGFHRHGVQPGLGRDGEGTGGRSKVSSSLSRAIAASPFAAVRRSWSTIHPRPMAKGADILVHEAMYVPALEQYIRDRIAKGSPIFQAFQG